MGSGRNIYSYDLSSHTYELINTDEFGTPRAAYNQYPSISNTGEFITFTSNTLPGESFYTGDSNTHVLMKNKITGAVEVIDVNSGGIAANQGTYGNSSISDDGRYVVFQSYATNLDAGKTNPGQMDIFLRDRQNGTTVLVSKTPGGVEGNNYSENPRISGNGTKILFSSHASDLVANDTNNNIDLFSYDIATGNVARVSVDENGNEASDGYDVNGKISDDGTKIALATTHTLSALDNNSGSPDIYLYDTAMPGTVDMATVSYNTAPSSRSLFPTLSSDGNLVLFESRANNLTPLDIQNYTNIFLHNRTANTNILISKALGGVAPDGNSGSARMSADNKFIVFQSNANNLDVIDTNINPDIFLYDVTADTVSLISKATDGTVSDSYSRQPSISADGRYITYVSEGTNLVANDTNNEADVFLYDRITQTTTRVNVDSSGNEAHKPTSDSNPAASRPQITADGTKVIFSSFQSNLVANDTNNAEDIFVRDLTNNTTTRISTDTNGAELSKGAMFPSISENASIIAYQEPLKNGNRIFYYDTSDSSVHQVASPTGHTSYTPYFRNPSVSGNGKFITFESFADNLVPGDTNHRWDTFQYSIPTQTLTRISTDAAGVEANKQEWIPYYSPASMSRNGKTIAHVSTASNLVSGDTDGVEDIFITSMENAKVSFSNPTITANENDGTANITLDISEGVLLTNRTVTITVTGGTALNGTDYTFSSPATITIPGGDYTTPQQLSVPVTLLTDNLAEGNETMTFALGISDPALEAGTNMTTQITLQNSPNTPPPVSAFNGGGGGYTPTNSNRNENQEMINQNTNSPEQNENSNTTNTNTNTHPDNTNSQSPTRPSAPERPTDASTPVGRFSIPFKDTVCYPMKSQDPAVAKNISQEDLRIFVEDLLKKGVAFQKDGEQFDPTATVNRSEMLRYIIQGNCEDFRQFSEFPAPFADVSITHKDALFVYLAKLRHIVRGYIHDGTFKPDNSISRAEALKVVLEMTLSDGTMKFSGTAEPFTDVHWNDENTWYRDYLSYAVEKGIITIPESKHFRPNDPALKSEIIYMLARSLAVKNQ